MSRWVAVKKTEGQHSLSPDLLPRYEINLIYWWPGRVFENPDELPSKFMSLVDQCERSGSLYLVYATTTVPLGPVNRPVVVNAHARCMGVDTKILRKIHGRNKALGRLKQKLLKIGYNVEELEEEELLE